MDNLTHVVLGAAIGQLVAPRRLGGYALALGALGNTLPDLDGVASVRAGPFAEWQSHRGITHSLFFGPVVGPILGWGLWHAYRRWRPASVCAGDGALGPMIAVMTLALMAHPLLDLFTIYGTQLLAPFSEARFAIPAVAIIDPICTVPLLIAVVIGMAARMRRWAASSFASPICATACPGRRSPAGGASISPSPASTRSRWPAMVRRPATHDKVGPC